MQKRKTKRSPKNLRHHARRLYQITPKFVHGMGIGAFVGIIVVMTLGPILPVSALTLSSPRDCDTNAVINCGALTPGELQKKYKYTMNAGVVNIYKWYGIESSDIAEIHKTAVAGRVYKNGNVVVNGKVVATNAITAGRHNAPGSTRVTHKGTVFYNRPNQASFRVDSIAAFVVLDKDGVFKFGILAACGNPVKATAKKVPAPEPPKEEPEPTPEPEPEDTPTVVVKASTQTPESTPTPIVLADSSTEELPATGPTDIIFVVGLAILGGYIYHVTHRHIKRRRHI